jgi:hypothetical protein
MEDDLRESRAGYWRVEPVLGRLIADLLASVAHPILNQPAQSAPQRTLGHAIVERLIERQIDYDTTAGPPYVGTGTITRNPALSASSSASGPKCELAQASCM